ncbi:MAG: hypothetical protein ABW048_12815 [Sphingobium sp.]
MSERIIRFLLTSAAGGEIGSRLAALAEEIPGGVDIGYGVRDERASPAGTQHGAALGDSPLLFDAYVEYRERDGGESGEGDFGRLTTVATDAMGRMAPWIDATSSSIIVGHRHVLMPRRAPFMMIFALSPPPGMGQDGFLGHWRDRHGPMVVEAARGKGSYYQLHGDTVRTAALADVLGIGGLRLSGHAGGWMRDPEMLTRSLAVPSALVALEDERLFIDHSRSSMGVYRVDYDSEAIAATG